jgi:hypothetical protein
MSKRSKKITATFTNKSVIRRVEYMMFGIRFIFFIIEFLMNFKILCSDTVVIKINIREYKALKSATT